MSQKDGKLDIDPVDYLDTWKVCKSANIFRICNVIKIDNFSQFQTALRFHYAISANLDILILIFFDSLKMILQRDIKIKAVSSVRETHANERTSAPVIHNLDDKIS